MNHQESIAPYVKLIAGPGNSDILNTQITAIFSDGDHFSCELDKALTHIDVIHAINLVLERKAKDDSE